MIRRYLWRICFTILGASIGISLGQMLFQGQARWPVLVILVLIHLLAYYNAGRYFDALEYRAKQHNDKKRSSDMLKRNPGSDETLIHVCTHSGGRPAVYLHDIRAYMLIDGKQVPIKYCPYCGTFIENDARDLFM